MHKNNGYVYNMSMTFFRGGESFPRGGEALPLVAGLATSRYADITL